MTPWTSVRMHLVGRKAASRLTGLARENLLREWGEGSRATVARVTDAEGRDLMPSQVDWSGMDEPPTLRGAPITTGRGRSIGKAVLVRLSADEHERIERAAGTHGVAAWMREQALRAAQ